MGAGLVDEIHDEPAGVADVPHRVLREVRFTIARNGSWNGRVGPEEIKKAVAAPESREAEKLPPICGGARGAGAVSLGWERVGEGRSNLFSHELFSSVAQIHFTPQNSIFNP